MMNMLSCKRHYEVALASAFLLAIAIALSAPLASAQEPGSVHLGAARERLAFLSDGAGHYMALEEGGASGNFYYGDGKTFYRQRVSLFSSDDSTSKYVFWAPNALAQHSEGGRLTKSAEGEWSLSCGGVEQALQEVAGDEHVRLENADFKEEKFQREVRFAARDEEGRYYIVDSLRDGYEQDWRLFVGRRGKLKELRLQDVVSDSGGDVFATSSGDLSFERRGRKRLAVWSHNSSSEELTFVPPELNTQLFYAGLGIYSEGLGTPCD